MDYIRKMVKSLIAGYVITLLMLVLLTYFMRKFIPVSYTHLTLPTNSRV